MTGFVLPNHCRVSPSHYYLLLGYELNQLPWWLNGKESTCQSGDLGSIPGWGRSPREENGNPLQHSCLENPMGRGAWWVTVQGVTMSWTQLSD